MLSIDFISSLIQANPSYIDDLYQQFLENPTEFKMVKERLEWIPFFTFLQKSADSKTLKSDPNNILESASFDDLNAFKLIEWYRNNGHLIAQTNPLANTITNGLSTGVTPPQPVFKKIPKNKNLYGGWAGLSDEDTAKELEKLYCEKVAIELEHLTEEKEKIWFIEQIEEQKRLDLTFSKEEKLSIYDFLFRAESFENFLNTKYVGSKRFSIEGGESFIPALYFLIEKASSQAVSEIFLGMAHRGRLNTLRNILNKPAQEIFSEFEDFQSSEPNNESGGDVKYHMGYKSTHLSKKGEVVELSLAYNPSHLESVNPVVLGQVRAKQSKLNIADKKNILGVLVHGDAAFVGQGIVYETLNLAQLKSHTTYGTLHIVINNQIGFTTNPSDSRSMCYCTEPAKLIGAPILHVNGNDTEKVIAALYLAFDYRQKFQKDVVVDICCYRKYGHNETDEPSFTQPLMYQTISQQQPVRTLYRTKLIQDTSASTEELIKIETDTLQALESSLVIARKEKRKSQPKVVTSTEEISLKTALSQAYLETLALVLTTPPAHFELHPKIAKLLNQRKEMMNGTIPLDFGSAELLSFGALLTDQIPIRLIGQDSRRGTFSQRQALWVDVKNGAEFIPYKEKFSSLFEVYDSALSEEAILGFEYGYSVEKANSLVLFEAQFGDFINGAQVIIDQYIAAGEEKWGQSSNLVILLPHGYEGQGPEHSSARIERFLQLSAKNNWQIVYPSTAGQYFHLLQKQGRRTLKKPLVVFSPKSLLRHPMSSSPISELTTGQFEPVLLEKNMGVLSTIKKLVFCTGKLFYELLEEKTKRNLTDVALIRIEQLYPFPDKEISLLMKKFSHVQTIIWGQEEPLNMGAREFIVPQLQTIFSKIQITVFGRQPSPSTACGSAKKHAKEQQAIIMEIFDTK